MRNNIKIIIICLIVNTICALGIIYYCNLSKPKTAFIEPAKVFSEFIYQKELNVKLQEVKNSRKLILDSMKINLQKLASQLEFINEKDRKKEDLSRFEYLKDNYYTKSKEFEEDNQALTNKYDGQIWTQINQYVNDYGKANGYEYVFGASGSGNLMYAIESQNITKEITEYVNDKYKGAK